MSATYIHDFEKWAKEFSYAAPLTVRFSDIDAFGIVNNAVIISYLEYARIEYLKHLGLMNNWLSPDCETVVVVADVQCDYRKPIVYDEQLQISVKINHVGNSSIDIHYLGIDSQSDVVFTGRSTLVQIDKKTGKGAPWTEEEKTSFPIMNVN